MHKFALKLWLYFRLLKLWASALDRWAKIVHILKIPNHNFMDTPFNIQGATTKI